MVKNVLKRHNYLFFQQLNQIFKILFTFVELVILQEDVSDFIALSSDQAQRRFFPAG